MYSILRSFDREELEQLVRTAIKRGYLPTGGVVLEDGAYMQAVYKLPVAQESWSPWKPPS